MADNENTAITYEDFMKVFDNIKPYKSQPIKLYVPLTKSLMKWAYKKSIAILDLTPKDYINFLKEKVSKMDKACNG